MMAAKYKTTFVLERNRDGSITVSGSNDKKEFRWNLGEVPTPLTALSAMVSQSLFRWWKEFDEFMPACRAELTLTNN